MRCLLGHASLKLPNVSHYRSGLAVHSRARFCASAI
jgi:hypothetical protein